MQLILSSPPAVEPVVLDDAKAHLRVDITDDDALITAMIVAARQRAENFTQRSFITQTWQLYLDRHDRHLWPPLLFDKKPGRGRIRLRMPPVTALNAFEYQSAAGVWSAIDPTTWYFDAATGQIVMTDCLPDPAVDVSAYRATYAAGYGADGSTVPESIKLAIKTFVLHFYENRGAFDPGNLMPVPAAGESLLMPYKIMDY